VTQLTELEAADAFCRYLAGRHYENFSVASSYLPAEVRLHLARIYAFARTTDDLGDESGAAALSRLAQWREQVARCFEQEPGGSPRGRPAPIHPVLIALSRSIDELDLPAEPFLDLIAANVQDQTVNSYAEWPALQAYCYLSAAPVGRLVLRVFGVKEPAAVPLSDDVCIGLQLANFAQDVSVDREKGRTYLPQSDIASAGIRGAVRLLCDQGDRLLQSGWELQTMVPLPLRFQLALYRLGGGAIIRAVREMEYRTEERRPQLSRLTKARLLPLAIQQIRRKREYVPAHRTA
jgi:squalene synthase HpnC